MSVHAVQTLPTVRRLGVLGGHHGDLDDTRRAATFLAGRGVSVILQIGSLDALAPHDNSALHLNTLSTCLSERQQTFFWVGDDPHVLPKLGQHRTDVDGLHWLRPNIAYVPRGYHTRIGGRFDLHIGTAVTISAENTMPSCILVLDQSSARKRNIVILDTVTLELTRFDRSVAFRPRSAARPKPHNPNHF